MELTHYCKKCKNTLPLSAFTETKQQGYKLQADGKRYKLDMCKNCRREYNASKKQEQREREAKAIQEAKEIGLDYALIPVKSKAPLRKMKGGVIGTLRRVTVT